MQKNRAAIARDEAIHGIIPDCIKQDFGILQSAISHLTPNEQTSTRTIGQVDPKYYCRIEVETLLGDTAKLKKTRR